MEHYIYQHIRLDTGLPFYVGMGKARRAWHIGKNRSRWWNSVAAKAGGRKVEILASGLDKELAALAECELIDKYRRLRVPLVNMTTGGDGSNFLLPHQRAKQRARTIAAFTKPETKQRHRDGLLKAWADPAIRAERTASMKAAQSDPAMRARRSQISRAVWKRDGLRERVSEAMSAAYQRPEARARKSAASKAIAAVRATPVQCLSTGQTFASMADAAAWVRQNTTFKATPSKICLACQGHRPTAYGYQWQYARGKN